MKGDFNDDYKRRVATGEYGSNQRKAEMLVNGILGTAIVGVLGFLGAKTRHDMRMEEIEENKRIFPRKKKKK